MELFWAVRHTFKFNIGINKIQQTCFVFILLRHDVTFKSFQVKIGHVSISRNSNWVSSEKYSVKTSRGVTQNL